MPICWWPVAHPEAALFKTLDGSNFYVPESCVENLFPTADSMWEKKKELWEKKKSE
jgi:hypothetical protein